MSTLPIETWQAEHPAWSGSEPLSLVGLRARALDALVALGLPTPGDEAWHYTSLRKVGADAVRFLPAAAFDGLSVEGAREVSFVNGQRVAGELADVIDAGELVGALAPIGDGVAALSAAFVQGGAFIEVAAGADGGLVHLRHATVGASAHAQTRHVVRVGRGARLVVAETFVGQDDAGSLAGHTTELWVEDGAEVTHVVVDAEGQGARLRSLWVQVGRDAKFSAHTSTLGGSLVRSEIGVTITAPGAEVALDGLYLVGAGQHVDHRTLVTHGAPHGTTRETYAGVVAGGGRGVFDGTVIVAKGADKTDASQSCRNLLLEAGAEADAKPRLEIYADDVKCAHGTTVGQLDAQQLAYLRSRGVPKEVARHLLTAAFVAERVEALRHDGLRERLRSAVTARLDGLLGGLS